MRHSRWSLLRGALSAGLIATAAACADGTPTGPSAAAPSPATLSVAANRPAHTPPLLVCPGGRPQRASAVIGAGGGTLALGGHLMVVPEGAVPQPTEFTMTLPPSRYVEVDITAAGAEHYTFARPVSVVIDYSRCRGPLLPSSDLSVWYIEGQNKELVQDMGGVDDRLSRRVQFWTDHLSSYAIAY